MGGMGGDLKLPDLERVLWTGVFYLQWAKWAWLKEEDCRRHGQSVPFVINTSAIEAWVPFRMGVLRECMFCRLQISIRTAH
ncbi:hypothetical protein Tco_0247164 [Tanacetum coccineum]